MANAVKKTQTGWVGWIVFASVMMILSGLFQMVVAFTAILRDEFFVVVNNTLFTYDVTVWGWIHLVISFIIIAAGFAVLNGRPWARAIGVLMAAISALANMAYIPYYPLWSLLIITVDVIVIYALVAHGSELKEE